MQEKITTIKKDNMKEKIEEIIERKLRYCPEVREADIYRVHRIRVEELKGELSTLIQEERKEAVEGFVDNIGWKKPSEVIDLADDVIDGRSLVKQMEAYLQSSDKGDKITSNTLTIDVSDFLSLWDTFCDWAKERRLDANIETFFSYLIWLKKQL